MNRRLVGALVALVATLGLVFGPAGVAAAGQDNSAELIQVDALGHPDIELVISLPGADDVEESLTVLENGEPVEVEVRPIGITGLRVVLVLDASSSMIGEPFEAAKQAAIAFVSSLPEGTSVAVVGISSEVSLVQPFTSDPVALFTSIGELRATGGTALYDGIAAGLTALGAPNGTDRALVVLSDGGDTHSKGTEADVIDQLAGADVQFTGIALQTSEGDSSQLDAVAEAAGGRVFAIDDPSLLVGVYGLVAASLESRYEVTYVSQSEAATNEVVVQVDGRPVVTEEVTYRSAVGAAPILELPEAPTTFVQSPGLLAHPAVPWVAALLIVGGLVGLVVVYRNDAERKAMRSAVETGFDDPASGQRGFEFDERIAAAERTNPSELLSGVADGIATAAESLIEKQGKTGDFARSIERAGLSIRPGELLAFALTASLAGLALGFAFGGLVVAAALALAPPVLLGPVLKVLAARRRKQFSEQLGDTLILISGALQAGYGLAQALDSVASEAPSPTNEEFGRALLETRLGLTLEQALDGVDDRMQCEDFRWVVNAVKINATVGGDLSKILDQVGDTIRARTKIKRQITALAAEGKISAIVLMALPPGLIFFIATSNPDYISPLFSTGTGNMILGFSATLMAVGGLWLRKLVNPEI